MAIKQPVKSIHDAFIESCKNNNIPYKERKKPLDHIVLDGSDGKSYVIKKDGNKIKIHPEEKNIYADELKRLALPNSLFEAISDNVHKRHFPTPPGIAGSIIHAPGNSEPKILDNPELKISDNSEKKNLETIN